MSNWKLGWYHLKLYILYFQILFFFLYLAEAAVPNQYELFSMEPPEDYHLFPGQNITTFPCVIADGRQGDDFNLVLVILSNMVYI